jgi:hypothetical protein
VAAGGVDEAAVLAFLLLQPATPSPATAATATSLIAVLFMHDPLLLPGRKTFCPAGLPSCCGAQHMQVGGPPKRGTVAKSSSEPICYISVISCPGVGRTVRTVKMIFTQVFAALSPMVVFV